MRNVVWLFLFWTYTAHAADMRLLSPNQGEPALVLRGGEFEVRATEQSQVALVSGDLRVPLAGVWSRNGTLCLVRVPEDMLPGKYAIEVGGATNYNAVFVYNEIPRRYSIACVPASTGPSPAALKEIVQLINSSGAALALFLGPLTSSGSAEDLKLAAEALRGCSAPTLTTPGADDIARGEYGHYFGSGWHGVRFGEDAYLSLNSADLVPLDELGQGPAEIQRFRRINRSARWTIAFTGRLSRRSALRTLLTLYTDDPADFVLSNDGLLRRKGFDAIAINSTPAPLPAAENGILLVEIGESGPTLPQAAAREQE